MRKNNKGLTLIELLITTSLIAMMGLAVYSVFSRGIAVWNVASVSDYREAEIRFALEKAARELRNSVGFPGATFSGTESEVSFPTYINVTRPDGVPMAEVGRAVYYYDAGNKAVLRSQQSYIESFGEGSPAAKEQVGSVSGLKFEYCRYRAGEKGHEWVDSWQHASGPPLGVRINLDAVIAGGQRHFIKTVYF